MGCSTCGNLPIRRALEGLTKNKCQDEVNKNTGIEKILATSSLQKISDQYEINSRNFPSHPGRFDWLGYLGLALRYYPSRRVSESWASQFIEILPVNGSPTNKLERILTNKSELLSWQFLEEIETALLQRKSQRRL